MRIGGIEPPPDPWQGSILPLNYIRKIEPNYNVDLPKKQINSESVDNYVDMLIKDSFFVFKNVFCP